MKKQTKRLIDEIKKDPKFYMIITFVLFNIFLAVYSTIIKNFYAIKGQIGFVVLGTVLYLIRDRLKLKRTAFFFLLLGFSLHLSHVLGRFYYQSPLPIPWDYLTHGISFIGITLLVFNYNKDCINTRKVFTGNIILFILLFFTIAGVGVIIELGEYAGYAIFGMEDGTLLFGGADFGEVVITSDVASTMEYHGGGWYDSMSDLLVNSYVSFLVLLGSFVVYIRGNKKSIN